jgi:integrase
VLILTGAYTGLRWGELVGLRHPNVILDGSEPRILIDPATGALHEVAGRLYLGPPKTEDSVRQVWLSPFLVQILAGGVGGR